mmetsp:Transcript_18789/g.39384  ORF Transcript_18789/g.39384 Transcript_18789/m.39384 type:complete len:179 (+) Transcript_18789:2350-2886(+)
MYTNINTDHAIEVINDWLDSLGAQLPEKFPTNAVKEAMSLVMKNNIFEFGDLHFLQLTGTEMGTSAVCMWATMYSAIHKMGCLIPSYGSNLPLFYQFVDDIIRVWTGPEQQWNNFKQETYNFGILQWEFDNLSREINFLDLTITIKNNKITTKTYQKDLNLYQYISPISANSSQNPSA